MDILTNLDFKQNQILNVSFQKLAVAPTLPVAGQPYFNTVTKRLYYYDGTEWKGADSNDAIAASHDHANKALLDTYTQSDTDIATAVSLKHTQNTDIGTENTTFQIGINSNGPKLKNNSGALYLRNSNDSSYANLTLNNIVVNGTITGKGNVTIGDGLNDTTTFNNTCITINTSGLKSDSDGASRNVFQIQDSAGTPNKLFEVRQNGDTVIAGVLTVNGTGTSSFAGDVVIAGRLTVEEGIEGGTDVNLGEDLTIEGNLIVHGNTTLGDNATQDTTEIIGVTTIKSGITKAVGSSTIDVFKVVDSIGDGLFQVKQNGDTVIAGVLTVNGTGTSSFAGDVVIGGRLTVEEGIEGGAHADLSGEDLTLTGNLVVHGSTTLGDNSVNDTTDIFGVTTIKSPVTKENGSANTDIFRILDSVGTGLFQVKQNGDTVIGGILTVNGEGTSTFAGDVSIGGALTVSKDAVVNANLQSDNLTLTGNLIVKGNTTLGDAETDQVNVVGIVTLPENITIGEILYSDLTEMETLKHTQNTDTGTSNATFQLGGASGIKIKNGNGGLELQIRNAADNGYGNLRVGDLYVEGTTTTIESNTVSIGDSTLELNSDITTSATNSDGGITIKRLASDNTTRKDAKLIFNNSSGKWETTGGAVTGELITAQIANKVSAIIGNGTDTEFTITHKLNTRDVIVSVRSNNSPYDIVLTDIEIPTVNTVKIRFASAPSNNAYSVTIIG